MSSVYNEHCIMPVEAAMAFHPIFPPIDIGNLYKQLPMQLKSPPSLVRIIKNHYARSCLVVGFNHNATQTSDWIETHAKEFKIAGLNTVGSILFMAPDLSLVDPAVLKDFVSNLCFRELIIDDSAYCVDIVRAARQPGETRVRGVPCTVHKDRACGNPAWTSNRAFINKVNKNKDGADCVFHPGGPKLRLSGKCKGDAAAMMEFSRFFSTIVVGEPKENLPPGLDGLALVQAWFDAVETPTGEGHLERYLTLHHQYNGEASEIFNSKESQVPRLAARLANNSRRHGVVMCEGRVVVIDYGRDGPPNREYAQLSASLSRVNCQGLLCNCRSRDYHGFLQVAHGVISPVNKNARRPIINVSELLWSCHPNQ